MSFVYNICGWEGWREGGSFDSLLLHSMYTPHVVFVKSSELIVIILCLLSSMAALKYFSDSYLIIVP